MAKRILIIGNSDGIGAATTAALVARGDGVVGVSRSPSPLVPPARRDDSHRHEVMDVTDPAYPELLDRLVREAGPFDACIYCVGVGSELELSDLSHEARVFEVNLTAMVRTLEILLPPWLERGTGHFVGLSSLADTLLNPGAPSYSASKAGFSNYLLGMALRLRPHGIAVTNIRFGFVDQDGQSGQQAVDDDRRSRGQASTGLPRDTSDSAQPPQGRRRRGPSCALAPSHSCVVVLNISGCRVVGRGQPGSALGSER